MPYAVKSTILCLLLLLFAVPQVHALDPTACYTDIDKFCQKVKPGGGRLASCLREHAQELSTECRDYQTAILRKTRKAYPVCQDDVEQFCRDIRPIERRIIRCLFKNEGQLSAECRDKLNAVRQQQGGQ